MKKIRILAKWEDNPPIYPFFLKNHKKLLLNKGFADYINSHCDMALLIKDFTIVSPFSKPKLELYEI